METLQALTGLVSLLGGLLALIIAVTKYKHLAVRLSAHFLLAVSTLVIIGYAMNFPQIYTVPAHGVGVALPTAICFMVTGAALLILLNGKPK